MCLPLFPEVGKMRLPPCYTTYLLRARLMGGLVVQLLDDDIIRAWGSLLGENPEVVADPSGRELWFVQGEDSLKYILKRLGPWPNLPLADEVRVLQHLAYQGILVSQFVPTDAATIFAGEVEESFVLQPMLPNDLFTPAETLRFEDVIGKALARLHSALRVYPRPVHSYNENLVQALNQPLMLPAHLATAFEPVRAGLLAAIPRLPVQLIHGDMTPGNVLLKKPGDISGFIDFDHLPIGPRVWDIAKFLSRRLRQMWRGEGGDTGRLDHLQPFLTGYHQHSPLESHEIAVLPDLTLAANVIESSYFAEIAAGKLERRRLPDHDLVLMDSLEAAEWHLRHRNEVAVAMKSAIAW